MPSTFPTAPDNIRTDIVNGTAEADTHPNLHNQLAESINAVQASLLAGGSLAPGTNGFAVGSVGSPSIFFTGDTNTGIYHPAADQVAISTAGVQRLLVSETGLVSIPLLNPTVLAPPSNFIEQRNGTNPQRLFIYYSYTDASNYERLAIRTGGGIAEIRAEQAGSGVARPLYVGTNNNAGFYFVSNSINRWLVHGSLGALLAETDNAYDIGVAGSNRPRNIYQSGGTFQSYNPGAGIANDGTNYERLGIEWSANVARIFTMQAGTGVARALMLYTTGAHEVQLGTNSVVKWRVGVAGELFAQADNTYDVGSSATQRPRSIYVGTSVVTPMVNTPLLSPTGNQVEIRNGTNSQTLNIFKTYTDGSNYARLTTYFTGFQALVLADSLGTGGTLHLVVGTTQATGNLHLRAGGVDRWILQSAGHLAAGADNAYDIGAAGAKPRNLFVAGAVTTGAKAGAAIDADVNTPTDGMLRLDTTNHRLYVRSGAVWKYAALT